MDRASLALAIYKGEQEDLDLEGTAKLLKEWLVPAKTCYNLLMSEEPVTDDLLKAMLAAGYLPFDIIKLMWIADDKDHSLEDIIDSAAAEGVPLSVLLAAIAEGNKAIDDDTSVDDEEESTEAEEDEREDEDEEPDWTDDVLTQVATSYDITAEDNDVLIQLKDMFEDKDDLYEFLRDNNVPLERRVRIMAKVLGI